MAKDKDKAIGFTEYTAYDADGEGAIRHVETPSADSEFDGFHSPARVAREDPAPTIVTPAHERGAAAMPAPAARERAGTALGDSAGSGDGLGAGAGVDPEIEAILALGRRPVHPQPRDPKLDMLLELGAHTTTDDTVTPGERAQQHKADIIRELEAGREGGAGAGAGEAARAYPARNTNLIPDIEDAPTPYIICPTLMAELGIPTVIFALMGIAAFYANEHFHFFGDGHSG